MNIRKIKEMKFYDFIGNEILPGSYVAYPGAGNVKSEYGLILYRVDSLDLIKQKVKATRIHVYWAGGSDGNTFHASHEKNAIFTTAKIVNGDYPKGKEHRVAVQFKQSLLENTNKLVVVNPSEKVKVIFDKILSGDESVFELIDGFSLSNWVHAAYPQLNPFRQ